METGERLAAYLAGDLPPGDIAELEAELAREPELRRELERIRAVDDALGSLRTPTPSETFSARLREVAPRTADEAAGGAHPETIPSVPAPMESPEDELRRRRAGRRRTIVPVAGAAAAAAAIALIGVVTGYGLRGADRDTGVIASLDRPIPEVVVRATDNDYSELELGRLAVNVDTTAHVLPGSTADEAEPVADAIVGRLLRRDTRVPEDGAPLADAPAAQEDREAAEATADVAEDAPTVEGGDEREDPAAAAVERCLPGLLQDTRAPLVPVYVEVASFEGEPAVVYAFLTEEPRSARFQRVEVVAVDQASCAALGSAQYDRVR